MGFQFEGVIYIGMSWHVRVYTNCWVKACKQQKITKKTLSVQ